MVLSNKKKMLFITLIFLAVHLVVGGVLNLTDDEAYYWLWSKHLDISYFDHPPIVAYLIKISTSLFGATSIGVRFFGAVSIAVVSVFTYLISKELFDDEEKAVLAVLILNIIPVIYLAGNMMLPDMPMLMFYTIGIYIFIKIVKQENKNLWYLFGIVCGLGMLSKYNMVLIFASILLYCIISKKERFWFARKEPYLAVIIAFLIFSPVFIWNNSNNWASFGFHLYGRHSHTLSIKPHLVSQFLGSQLALVSPVIFVGFFIAVFRNLRDTRVRLLALFSLPVFLLFFGVSFISQTKVHWAAMAYIPMTVIFANKIKLTNLWKFGGLGIALALSILITVQSFYPVIPLKPKVDITTDMYGWDIAAKEVNAIYSELDKEKWFLFSNRYQLSSQLEFYLKSDIYVYSLASKTEQYDFWKDKNLLKGKNGIFVTHSFYKREPENLYNFDKTELIKEINIYRRGEIYRTFFIYKCYNYQGYKSN